MSWSEKQGDLKCKHDGQDFDGDSSYHKTYAQCSKWPKNVNATITLVLDGKSSETTPQKAIDIGSYPRKMNFDELNWELGQYVNDYVYKFFYFSSLCTNILQ